MGIEAGQLRDFAERYTAAWCSLDSARVAEFYAPDGSLTINDGAPAIGRSAISEAAQSFMTGFPDMRVVMNDLLLKDGYAEYHWTLTGRHTGPGDTGRAVRISGLERWRMGADGLISASEGHFDASEYRRQLEQGT
jgi:uncharacterized protein (TIGR02246 family)